MKNAPQRHVVALLGAVLLIAASRQVGIAQDMARLEQIEPINDLFKKADEGIARSDWKFVVDSLQRVIDDPRGALVSHDERLYESARRQAYRQLVALPPAGRYAYHLLNDSEARTLFNTALTEHNHQGLQEIVDRYFLTEVGDDAATLLANWYVDIGQPVPAISLLRDVAELYPPTESSLVKTKVAAVSAIAYAQLGSIDQANEHLRVLREGTAHLPEWQERVRGIESFVNSLSAAPGPRSSGAPKGSGWHLFEGHPGRGAHMPATVPAFLNDLPWHCDLPLDAPLDWTATTSGAAAQVVFQVVTDASHLFIKAGRNVAALDLVNFDQSWVSRAPSIGGELSRRAANRNEQAPEDVARRITLEDHLNAQMSVAHGLLYTLDFDQHLAIRPSNIQLRRAGFLLQQNLPPGGNLLVARDLKRGGKILWYLNAPTSASGAKHADEGVVFLAAPVPFGREILVPYRRDKDLYVATINPSTGTTVDVLHLCTLPDLQVSPLHPLPPAVDTRSAYIPTNAGLLLALNTADHSLSWASRYDRDLSEDDDRYPGPPVIAGRCVILAPTDSDRILAFDRNTGEILWQRFRGAHAYIIASDGGHIWLGGESVSALESSSGRQVWTTEVGQTTGRAVLSGDRILVPTRAGLKMLDAHTGEKLESMPLPADEPPLGNLLCWAGALFSIDSQQVRKFPDIVQSYEPTRSRHQADPADAVLAIQLAWMELFQNAPQRALEALEQVELGASTEDKRRRQHVNHLKVKALVALASGENLMEDQAIRHLRRATEFAETPQDSFDVALALSDQLARNHSPSQAYKHLWRLNQNQRLEFSADQHGLVRLSARSLVRQKMSDLRGEMGEQEQRLLVAALQEELPLTIPLPRRGDTSLWRRLDALAEGDDLNNWNQAGAIRLARWAVSRRKYEEAEYYYTSVFERGRDPSFAAAALLELGEMYLHDDLQIPEMALPLVERLRTELSDLVPDGAEVSRMRESTAALEEQINSGMRLLEERFTSAAAENAYSDGALVEAQFLHFDDTRSSSPKDLFITFSAPNRLEAYRPSSGETAWATELRMIEDPSSRIPGRMRFSSRTASGSSQFRFGLHDGQTLLVNTQTSLHAVGLATGLRLWVLPFKVSGADVTSSAFFDIANGRVAFRARPHSLQLLRSIDGKLQWEVRVPEHDLGYVRIMNDRVLAIDLRGSVLMCFDIQTGQLVFQRSLEAPTKALPQSVVLFDGLVCGRKGKNLVAYSLKDGRDLWSLPLAFTPTCLTKASDQCLLVGGKTGKVLAVHPVSGEVLFSGKLDFSPLGIQHGHLEDGVLYVVGLGPSQGARGIHLAAIDLRKQEPKWINKNLSQRMLQVGSLRALPDVIPLVYDFNPKERIKRPDFLKDVDQAVVFLDKQTGRPLGDPLPVVLGDRYRLTGEIAFWPHRMVLGTTGGIKYLTLRQSSEINLRNW